MDYETLARKYNGRVESDDELDALARKYGGEIVSGNAAPVTGRDKYLSSMPVRIAKGMKDPIDALAQMAPRGLAALVEGHGLPWGGPVVPGSFREALIDQLREQAQDVDTSVKEAEAEYQAAQAKAGTGTDVARLGGNVLSPANVIPARAIGPGAFSTAGAAARTGAIAGAAGGAMQPVTEGDFGTTKATQTAVGGMGGALLSPVVAKVAQIVVPRVVNFFNKTPPQMIGAEDVEAAIRKALKDARLDAKELGPEVMDGLRAQVRQSLSSGRALDVAAAARKADFEALGMEPTLGQITRDPATYAREMNLRGVEGVGEPLMLRMQGQTQKLKGALEGVTGQADETYRAGKRISESLSKTDEAMADEVRKAYQAARAATGKDLDVPLQGLSQDAARILDDYGTSVPGAVRARLERYGILPGQEGQQTKVFTFDEAEKLLQQINKHGGPKSEDAQNAALGELRAAVKRAILSADDAGGPFSEARALAAKRFQLHEAVPALEAASRGTASADDFVSRFLVRADTDKVMRTGILLQKSDPAAFADARSQIGAHLQRAAFGENAAGDKVFSPERFAKALREIGTDKLLAFYSPKEVETLKRISRVGANIFAFPDRAAVNTSNNAGWVLSVLQRLPLGSQTLSLGKAAATAASRGAQAKASLLAKVPEEAAKLSPELEAEIARYLSGGAVGLGIASGASFR